MDFFKTRSELRRMGIKELLKMVSDQKIRNCIIGGKSCPFYIYYKNFNFCVSEILGEGCQVERVEKLEEIFYEDDQAIFLHPFLPELELGPASIKKGMSGVKVYWRDRLTRSVILLGRVIERRKKERENNFCNLLKRAIMDFSEQVKDPSGIFLMGP